jgi:monothiol glutaredoxin
MDKIDAIVVAMAQMEIRLNHARLLYYREVNLIPREPKLFRPVHTRHQVTVMKYATFLALALGCTWSLDHASGFTSPSIVTRTSTSTTSTRLNLAEEVDEQAKKDALQAAIDTMYGDKPLESPNVTRQRIQTLIENNKVVLFMKGTKFFPQCGFSDTATKILEALKVDFEAVDVLADESIRQGIKEYSQWPPIPQLYINQEFIGGVTL